MYGWRLRVISEGLLALILSTVLTFFSDAISWSDNALTILHYVLNSILIPASWAFIRISERHPDRKESFYNWFGMEIRMLHLCNNIGYGFGAIAIFHMGNAHFSDGWHFIATGWTVVNLALLLTGYFKTWSKYWHLFTWPILASGLWLGASFGWRISHVRYPEYALLLIGLVFLWAIVVKKKRVGQ